MREIEFRGKSNDEWVYGMLLKTEDDDYGEHGNEHFNYLIQTEENKQFERQKFYITDNSTIGQYTGLKDKNGKKIYEGDIVKKETFDDTKPNLRNISYAKVIYIEALAGFYLVNKDDKILWELGEDKYNIEVVSTIYDNPELLKEEL